MFGGHRSSKERRGCILNATQTQMTETMENL